jgi:outer membrane protein OmpA-like peptidoglycan-associated protein
MTRFFLKELIGALTILAWLPSDVLAQPKYSSTNSQAVRLYESGLEYYDKNQNEKAKLEFQKAIKKDSAFIEPYLVLADIDIEEGQYDNAILNYKKVVVINPTFYPTAYYTLAAIEFRVGKYEDALRHYQKYKTTPGAKQDLMTIVDFRMACCNFAMNAKSNPVEFDPKNLGIGVNSPYDEYFPSITVDDQTMIFTRNRPESEGSNRYHEDFYIANRKGQQWDVAKNAGGSLNTFGNEGVPCYSVDGKVLFFAACQRNDGKGSCDLYYSALRKDGWTKPLNLGGPVNTSLWESQPSFSSDGRTLYFIRGRITGNGIREQDIYMSRIGDDRKWSEPARLPANINTPEEEEFVYIHPDDQTLYFSSDGHVGMGGLDIYVSRRKSDGTWGDPVNLGYPINTFNDERGLLVGPQGDIAYISSDRKGGQGGLDLYSFQLHQSARPIATGYVKGVVVDAVTGAKLSTSLEIIDLQTRKSMVKSGTDESTGSFLASLPTGKDYLLNVSKEGYLFYSDNFSCKNAGNQSKAFELEVRLEPVREGSKVVLKNVFFPTNSFELQGESFPELEKLVVFLQKNPKVIIEISGHTDNVGDKKSNLTLSNNRAQSVMSYLVSQGISKTRMLSVGYGDTKPIADNATEEGKAQNRRTEFKIVSVQ